MRGVPERVDAMIENFRPDDPQRVGVAIADLLAGMNGATWRAGSTRRT